MKIQYASDLHLGFRENTQYLEEHPLEMAGDVLVLAGDISSLRKKGQYNHPFFDWCADNYRQTLIVPGNHEYFDGFDLQESLTDYRLDIRPNVCYMNNKSAVIDDTEIFLTTLWTIVNPIDIVPVQMGMADCHYMKFQGKDFCGVHYEQAHKQCMQFLNNGLAASIAKNKVVVTHHCPSLRYINPQYKDSSLNSAFFVDLDRYIEASNISHWIFGHTHYNVGDGDLIGNTTMHCNQLGYCRYGENKSFKHDAVMEV